MRPCFVGFDTSNYTTSAALCDEGGGVILNLKKPLPVKDGECGLRQSDAVFAHVRNLPEIADGLRYALETEHLIPVAVGVSSKPRDAEDSYMPCFLSGVAAAHSFAASLNLPIFEFSHQNGHIAAASYSAGKDPFESEFIAFHVSGGTTEVLRVVPKDGLFSSELVGGTSDLNAGQAIDRTGVMMGLHFPCGPALEELALAYLAGDGKIPHFRTSVKGTECNLSGLQNLASGLFSESGDKGVTAAAVFDFLGRTLREMTVNVRKKLGELPVIYAGGVMSNSIIKDMLSAEKNTFFADRAFSADNAVGTALLCRKKYSLTGGVV